MKLIKISIVPILLSMFLFSCSSAINKAEKTATLFYFYDMRQDYRDLIPLLDEKMLSNVKPQKWIQTLRNIQLERGAITKYNPTKVEVFKDTNNNLIVRFVYKVYYDKSTNTEELLLIQRRSKAPFKIIKYTYNYRMK